MAACEKCWAEAGRRAASSNRPVREFYPLVLMERMVGRPRHHKCTPEEMCGDLHVVGNYHDGTRHCRCGKVTREQRS